MTRQAPTVPQRRGAWWGDRLAGPSPADRKRTIDDVASQGYIHDMRKVGLRTLKNRRSAKAQRGLAELARRGLGSPWAQHSPRVYPGMAKGRPTREAQAPSHAQ